MAAESPAAAHLVFETPIGRIGREGLQLNKSLDELSMQEVSRISNLFHSGGDLYTRLGQNPLLPVGGVVHSVRRLNVPSPLQATWFWGGGTTWLRGGLTLGAPSVIASGFSGNPLTMLPVRPAFSGESWMVAADSNQMLKATLTSPALPLGLPVPTAPTTTVQPALTLGVRQFDASDSSDAGHWYGFRGRGPAELYNTVGAGVLPYSSAGAIPTNVTGVVGNAVALSLVVTSPPAGPGVLVGMASAFATPQNYSAFTGGTGITDDDVFHMNLRLDTPASVSEIRIYFTTSAFTMPQAFNPTTPAWSLPGMGIGSFTASAYLLVIRPSDYTNALAALETIQDAADQVRTAAFLETFADPVAAAVADTPTTEAAAGAGIWSTFGEIHFPVIRRGDFIKIGGAGSGPLNSGNDWTTITGMYVVILGVDQPTPPTTGASAGTNPPTFMSAAFDNMYFTGGSGPDTGSDIGGVKYDYRVTNFDSRTRARSNPSPIVTGAIGALNPSTGLILTADLNVPDLTLDALRQPIQITPPAYGPDPTILQEAWRRGGSLADNWRYVGINTANGGAIVDTFADDDIANADTVPIDHFQPVATVDTTGAVVLAQPLPVLFGPLRRWHRMWLG